jgi:CIC family chloride channel protein
MSKINSKRALLRFLNWRTRHLKDQHFKLLLSVVVGLISGLAAVVIKNSVFFIEELLTDGFAEQYHNYLYFAYPLVGILLVVTFVKYVIKKPVAHGIPNTLYAISSKNGIIKKHNLYSSVVSSAITIGFGGSAGLEGPTVSTTAAIGSNIGRIFKLNYKGKILLIGCAAAGALSAIFNAPIAAVVFALEVIMLDLTMGSIVPLLMASATAAITSRLFLGKDVLFHFSLRDTTSLGDIPYYLALGVVAGLFSIYFTRLYMFIAGLFERQMSVYKKAIWGGLALGILIFLFPPLYGEGYQTINYLVEGKPENVLSNSLFYEYRHHSYSILLFLICVVLLKVFATAITFGSGGIGGIFAPTLFMGSLVGFLYSRTINLFGLGRLSESNFTLVAMAGLMAGILHAPLTAIFLIAEITGGYSLFVPLMITASVAYLTVKFGTPNSVYTMQLAKRGKLITHHKDDSVLTLMKLYREVETDFTPVHPEQTLGELVKVISESRRNLFPVVDENEEFLGIVLLNDVRDIMFKKSLYDQVKVEDLMTNAPEAVAYADNMKSVMAKFESTGAWNLPVLQKGKYMGFVSKSKLFSAYRSLLQELHQDD